MGGGRQRACLAAVVAIMGVPIPCRGADGGGGRYYLQLRYAESLPFSRAHDGVGLSLGANLNRYLSAELSADFYEIQLDAPDVGNVAELGTAAIVPQARLRYPLLGDRLVPYVLGGAGVALTQVNDRSVRALGRPIESDDAAFVGSLGGGIEYVVADGVALGLDGRYLISSSHETTVDRVRVNSDLDAVLAAFSLRLLYPPLHPARDAGSGARGAWAAYVALRGGLAGPVNRDAFGQVEARAENAGVGDRFGQLFGAAIGVDLGPHLGLELPFAGYEMALELPGVGIIGEYALYVIIPQVRLRYPLLGDRLEVHVTAGVGPTYGEFNDRKPVTKGIGATRGGELGVGGIVGAGVEYFVTRNVALGCQAQYLVDRSHGLEVGGTEHAANLDSLLLALTLRVTLFESARSVPRWLAP